MESYLINPYQIAKTAAPSSDDTAGFSLIFLPLGEWEQLPKLLSTPKGRLEIEHFSKVKNYQENPNVEHSDDYLVNIRPRMYHLGPDVHYLLLRDIDEHDGGEMRIAFFLSPTTFIFVSWPDNILKQVTRWAKRGILDAPLNLANLLALLVFDHHQNWLDRLEDNLLAMEKDILQGPQISQQSQIILSNRQVLAIRKSVNLHRPVLARLGDLENTADHGLGDEIKEAIEQVLDTVQNTHDMVENLRDAYQTAIQNHTNDIMKFLTIMATVLLPINLLTSFFGMNFHNLPLIHKSYGLFTFFTASALIILLAIYLFRNKGYFHVWNTERTEKHP